MEAAASLPWNPQKSTNLDASIVYIQPTHKQITTQMQACMDAQTHVHAPTAVQV